MDHYSKIKEGLLKSGLPLESAVANSLDILSSKLPNPLINHGEYFFKREESQFPNSVDFSVTYDLDIKDCDFVQIVFLLECKYRTQGTTWYFAPNPLKDSGMEFFIENFFSKGKCNRKNFPSLAPPLSDETLPITWKGIEIYSNGERNEKTINEGIHQLMFAAASMLDRAFFSEKELLEVMQKRGIDIRGRSFHSLVCPVMVTTADLRFLREVSIKEIEKSKKPDDVSTCEKIVVYSTPKPPIYVQKYIKEVVAGNIIARFLSEVNKVDILHFLTEYSLFFPSRYYIVNYQSLEYFLTKYINFAGSMLRYACK